MNSTLFWAIFFKPFFVLVLAVLVLYPARMAVKRHMKAGKLKDLLMFRVGGDGVRWTPKLVVFWTGFILLYLGAFLLLVV